MIAISVLPLSCHRRCLSTGYPSFMYTTRIHISRPRQLPFLLALDQLIPTLLHSQPRVSSHTFLLGFRIILGSLIPGKDIPVYNGSM